jgi:hypothetical protein
MKKKSLLNEEGSGGHIHKHNQYTLGTDLPIFGLGPPDPDFNAI